MNAPKKLGRPPGSKNKSSSKTAAAEAAANEDFKRRLIKDAYDRPHLTLGTTFRLLVRDPKLAAEALQNASAAVLKQRISTPSYLNNAVAAESHVAALTRTVELAKAYPEELRHGLVSAHDRLKAAEFEVLDARKAVQRAQAAEDAWVEAFEKSTGAETTDLTARVTIRVEPSS